MIICRRKNDGFFKKKIKMVEVVKFLCDVIKIVVNEMLF